MQGQNIKKIKTLRLEFLLMLDQKTGREKVVLRKTILAIEKHLMGELEKTRKRARTG